VHEQPKESAPVIDTLPVGTMLRLGNKSQEGWRRAAIPIGDHRGKIGWIQEEAVNILDVSTTQGLEDTARAGKKKAPTSFRLMGGASMGFYSKSATDSSLATQLTYLAQGSFMLSKKIALGLRGTVTPVTVPTVNTSTGQSVNTTEYGIGFLVPVEYSFVTGATLQVFLGGGPSVGLPMGSGGSLTLGGAAYLGLSLYLGDDFFIRADGGLGFAKGETALSTTPFALGVLGLDF
jgi:hypothetical protein